ncbi:unnamed protein product [Polarella glacialis]|uniref:Uncharacterized protein n=1 Tax=Polarella glacialis TaxID=89957 RepID=A0A813M1T1_POLGL|nr:unnamed protein product [Polarella glacialis]
MVNNESKRTRASGWTPPYFSAGFSSKVEAEVPSRSGGHQKGRCRRRVIMIRMPENSREEAPARFAKTMGAGSLLVDLPLEADEVVVVDVDDLRDYYHSFVISQERTSTNAFNGEFRGSEFYGFHAYRPEWHDRRVVGALATLAIGDGQAVEIGQAAHVGLFRCGGC